ncbi:unnamed protein product [Caenorhabditis brenneri]
MSSTLMSLGTLQYLLQYMDANRRFEISNRCPSLREFEKSVPLRIDSLEFMKHLVTINDTTYQVGIIRKYNIGEAPELVKWDNKTGGVRYEVDKYGIEDLSDAKTRTPGDIKMKGRTMFENRRFQDENINRTLLENRIQNSEAHIAQLLERRPNANVAQFRNDIEANRAKLFAYDCRRDNIPPNYEHFVQITTWKLAEFWEQKAFERYHHNKKYSEAVKQLAKVLFGGRNCPIHVKEMEFKCRKGIIRLPVDVKFRVERLEFHAPVEKTLQELAPIIHESSYPLKQIAIHSPTNENFNHPIVRAAGRLKVRMAFISNLDVLLSLPNPRVHVRAAIIPNTFETIIGNWIESNRPIGTEYIFDFGNLALFMDVMEDFWKSLNGVPIDDENMVFPMNDAARLKISYGTFQEFAPRSKYAVRFFTEAIEN